MSGSVSRSSISSPIDSLLGQAAIEERATLLEHEAQEVVKLLGISVPDGVFIRADEDLIAAAESAWCSLWGSHVVMKVISPEIAHRTELGGVRIVPKQPQHIVETIEQMQERIAAFDVRGFLVSEIVDYDHSPGGELLVSVRWTRDFGPVVSLAPGGINAEHLARNMVPGREVSLFSPSLTPRDAIEDILEQNAITPIVTGSFRRQIPRMSLESMRELMIRLIEFSAENVPQPIEEIEINPLALTANGPVALDAFIRLGRAEPEPPARPIAKIRNLLEPRSVAVVGVSKQINPGRIIVRNLLQNGFDAKHIWIVKSGVEEIDGCRCVDSIDAIPGRVDLAVLSIAAEQVPELMERIIETEKAESVIVIPGGIGELVGSESLAEVLRSMIRRSRQTEWGGPVVNGANSLGLRSVPGHCDTFFLPDYKIAPVLTPSSNLAIVSQSGAFAVSIASRLGTISPRYLISIGNQLDLTAGDYMEYLANDRSVEVFGFYVEGFQPGDGRRWLQAANRAVEAGKTVVLYRAGRTAEGAKATASHTAAIAGDAVVTRELARHAGVVVAETLQDFEDLMKLFWRLRGRSVQGFRLAAMSNAGYECVALADNAGPFRLGPFGEGAAGKIRSLFAKDRLDRVMNVTNPLDVNPMMSDGAFVECAKVLLEDEGTDAAVVGCVPLTGALQTLPPDADHSEDLYSEGSVVTKLIELWHSTTKPWVMVVDAGPRYDTMADRLDQAGVPMFRRGDRAIRLLGIWARMVG